MLIWGCHRLEKRRQAMLEMPSMIQEWKEVCHPFLLHGFCGMLILDIRKDMVVGGRSGQNKLYIDESWIWYQTSGARSICTNIILDMDCMGEGVTTMAPRCKMYIMFDRGRAGRIENLRPNPQSRNLYHVTLFNVG